MVTDLGGTPPPPFTAIPPKNFLQKKVTDLGSISLPTFSDIPPKNVLKKVLKMVFFPKKHLFLVQKIGYGYGGHSPPPFTDKIRKVVFDILPKNSHFCCSGKF